MIVSKDIAWMDSNMPFLRGWGDLRPRKAICLPDPGSPARVLDEPVTALSRAVTGLATLGAMHLRSPSEGWCHHPNLRLRPCTAAADDGLKTLGNQFGL